MVELPPFQAAVLVHFFEKAPVADTANTLDFRFTGEFTGTFYAAHIAFAPQSAYEGCSLVTTLATHSDIVFFAVSGSSEVEVARVLGNLEDYDRETRSLSTGDAIRIPGTHSANADLHAVVLLRPATLSGFDEFNDCFTIKGRHLRFVVALFLTEEEYLFRKKHGHDALMDRFADECRSVVDFEPP